MTGGDSGSWSDLVDALRNAAGDIRNATGSGGAASPEEEAAAARLKADVSRLEHSAKELRATLTSSFERERAEASTEQLRSSLDELAGLARNLADELTAAASDSFDQARPDMNSAARALDDVAGSAAAWVRAVIDPGRNQPRGTTSEGRPPLDDL